MLNQLLGGHYRVIKNLGEGGLAKTYIAEDHHRPGHPKCAVKFLKPMSNDPNFLPTARRLFHQEAEILEKLGQHEQIPRLLAYFEQNQEFYLVQEFIEGHTLCRELKPGHRWSENKVIKLLQDVLPILEFVHSYRVIHRDIKPHNLIRRKKDGRLVLIDFGAVKQIRVPKITNNTQLTKKTIAIGTYGYMPVEQLRGKPRLNSDIYALGIICIQALTGVLPPNFNEDKDGELIWQHLTEISEELAAILSNMIRYHFPNRYQSATEVLQALQSLVNHNPIIPSTSDPRQASPILAPEKEERNSLVSARDSLSPSKDLQTIRANQVVQKTEVEQKVPSPSNHAPLNPPTLVNKQISPIVAPEEKERNNLVSPADSSAPSKDLESIHANKIVQNTEVEQKVPPLSNHAPLNSTTSATKRISPIGVSEQEERSSLVFPTDILAPSKGLESIHLPTFVSLNKPLLLMGVGIVSVFVSLFAIYTYITHKQGYLKAQGALRQIEILKQAEKYQECLQQAQAFPQDYSQLHTEAQRLKYDCQQGQAKRQLGEARKLAQQRRFKDAIVLAAQVPSNSDFYLEAEQLISGWSEEIFQIANNKYQEGNLQEAIAIAEAIPTFSPRAKKAQDIIQQWNKEWMQNQTYLQEAQKALDERRWQDAINAAKKISSNSYWQKQSELIIQKAQAEIASAQGATSRKIYKPGSRSIRRRSRSGSYRSRTVRRSRSNSTKSPSISTKSRSISIKSPPSSSLSGSSSTSSRSNSWTCLNNPNPRCRR